MEKITMYKNSKGEIFDTKEDCALSDGMFKCPKCGGVGTLNIRYNAYPSNLPDSGWVDDWKFKNVDCEVCLGEGYTITEKKPVTQITGYI